MVTVRSVVFARSALSVCLDYTSRVDREIKLRKNYIQYFIVLFVFQKQSLRVWHSRTKESTAAVPYHENNPIRSRRQLRSQRHDSSHIVDCEAVTARYNKEFVCIICSNQTNVTRARANEIPDELNYLLRTLCTLRGLNTLKRTRGVRDDEVVNGRVDQSIAVVCVDRGLDAEGQRLQ